jgi:hypothetical protein
VSIDLDLSKLSHAEKDALILTLSARLNEALKLIAALQARIDELTRPGKTPGKSIAAIIRFRQLIKRDTQYSAFDALHASGGGCDP